MKHHTRHYLLLEVLIAFALVALCILPLISPHLTVFNAQKEFVNKVELDHVVNLIYADIYERLYRNEIPWNGIIGKTVFPVDDALLKRIEWDKAVPFQGMYQFKIYKKKPVKPAAYSLNLIELTIAFLPLKAVSSEKNIEKPITYEYKILIERNLGEGQPEEVSDQNGKKEENEKKAGDE